jgi:hypothetical protein
LGVRVESSRACLGDPESSLELRISSCIFSFDCFNISNLLYLLESALLFASYLSSQVLVLVCRSSLSLVQFKLPFLLVGACLTDILARTIVT